MTPARKLSQGQSGEEDSDEGFHDDDEIAPEIRIIEQEKRAARRRTVRSRTFAVKTNTKEDLRELRYRVYKLMKKNLIGKLLSNRQRDTRPIFVMVWS